MPPQDHTPQDNNAYLIPEQNRKGQVQPLSDNSQSDDHSARQDNQQAADLIRQKINTLYSQEPSAEKETVDILRADQPRSKHQRFMYDLTVSGKPLAEIQTAWHNYYQALPDKEKHEVWEEFYAANNQPARFGQTHKPVVEPASRPHATHHEPEKTHHTGSPSRSNHRRAPKTRSVAEIKHRVLQTVSARGKLQKRQHLQSLIFGFGLGSLVLLVLLFGFFNERFVAPFITPSRQVSSTPIIIDSNSAVVGPEPKVIIPKINVEIPVVYDEPSVEEKALQKALERGVVHYATTPKPGEKGNSVIFGHSSNNIFNKGKYKFAFVLLSRLEAGDLFYLTKDGRRYAYKVYKKEIVKPDAIRVLGGTDKTATATLITCDPPGTSLNRLVVIGEQISPDPSTNTESTAAQGGSQPKIIPSNAPSLWSRLFEWISR